MKITVNNKNYDLNDNYLTFKNSLICKCLENKKELMFNDRDTFIFENIILKILNGKAIDNGINHKILDKFDYDIIDSINYLNQIVFDELNFFNLYNMTPDITNEIYYKTLMEINSISIDYHNNFNSIDQNFKRIIS